MSRELVTTNGGFDSLAIADTEAGTLANVAREESELKAAIFLARNFPRDEAKAHAKLVRSCERPNFATGAQYSFPRGGTEVKGPSIDLAREAARCWGNIRYGLRLVTLDEESVHIKGYALDLETNSYVEMEDKFARLIQRKGKGWVKPDERDLRELINRRGAICVRNAILQLLPPDAIEAACKQADETMRKAARGDLEGHRDDTVKALVVSFDRMGVSTEMLVKFLGHELRLITAEELTRLRTIYKSLADGNSKPSEYFDYGDAAAEPSPKTADLNDKLKAARGSKDAAKEPAREESPKEEEPKQETAETPASESPPEKPATAAAELEAAGDYRIVGGPWADTPLKGIPAEDLQKIFIGADDAREGMTKKDIEAVKKFVSLKG